MRELGFKYTRLRNNEGRNASPSYWYVRGEPPYHTITVDGIDTTPTLTIEPPGGWTTNVVTLPPFKKTKF